MSLPPPHRPPAPPEGLDPSSVNPSEGSAGVHSFHVGDLIAGKYLVERVIGIGGMGVVLAARHLELDEPVAIKTLLPHLALAGEPVARFLREAKAAIKIKNDHVVRVLDVGRTEAGAPYIVMEYLEGCDLGQLVETDGPLPIEDVVDYVVQACEAIAAAHALGIVHRDLKPANLFLTRTSDGAPCVKVLDFGISKIVGGGSGTRRWSTGLTSTATVMGTPCFMSPEQLRSTRDVDARTDIWSMGAIIHALVTGMPPYDGESNADVSAKIIRDAPTPLRALRAEVSAGLEAIVLRCLEKDPARRFPDIATLANALADATPRASSKNGAQRVGRIAAASAPTMMSAPFPVVGTAAHDTARLLGPGHAGAAPVRLPGSDPTRTASAWGDTRREEKRGRRIAGIIAVSGLAIAVAVFGTLRLRHMASAASASTTGAPSGEMAGPTPAQAATAASARTPTGAPVIEEGVGPEPPGAAAASLVKPTGRARVKPTATAIPTAKAAPSATSSSSAGDGLFNKRQ
jgi:serine/threonine-protein kinase